MILTGLGESDLTKVKEECEAYGVNAWAKETHLDNYSSIDEFHDYVMGLGVNIDLFVLNDAMEMVIVTSDYWGAVHGADPGEVQQDIEGLEVVAKLARNIAWTVKVIDAARGKIDPPETHPRTFTNFIR